MLARRRSVLLLFVLLGMVAACSAPAAPTPAPTRTVGPTVMPSPMSSSTGTPSPIPATTPSPVIRPTPVVTPYAEPTADHFSDVDAQSLLQALFPDLRFTFTGSDYVVNGRPDWLMWIESKVEGRFTQSVTPEFAVIVANEAPNTSDDERQRTAPWGSFLAIFQQQGSGLQVIQRSMVFPIDISPLTFDAKINRVVDLDHDGQNELLVVTNSTRAGISSTAAFLYRWKDQAFAEIWSAPAGEDNTAAINQTQYYASTSEFQFSDLNGDGLDDIVMVTTRVDYAQDDQGLADVEHETGRRVERKVFSWGGAAFVPNFALSSTP